MRDTDDTLDDPPAGTRPIQSIARAVAILEIIAREGGAASLKEIADRTGLGKTTAHNILRTLGELGYVRRSPAFHGNPARSDARQHVRVKNFRLCHHAHRAGGPLAALPGLLATPWAALAAAIIAFGIAHTVGRASRPSASA